jgi:transcriptional regulator with XRE-family HTH domain
VIKTLYRREQAVLAEFLRELRTRSGLTQADLAPLLGRPQNRVSDLERGGRRVDVVEFIDYCRALQYEPLDAFEELLRRMSTKGVSKGKRKRTPT